MAEDFNKLKLLVKRLVRTQFQPAWAFKLQIEEQPDDLDIYVKDISYGPTEISNEPVKVGNRTLTYPIGFQPVSLSVTVRESKDGKVRKFFDKWAEKCGNKNGTMNLPYGTDGYVKKVKKFVIFEDGKEELRDTWEMFPVQLGDVTESREDGNHLEFPMTFIQFRS